MKVTGSQWILLTAACLIFASSAAQSDADRPPGVDDNNWVPISDSAGIVVTNAAGMPAAARLDMRNGEVTVIPQLLGRGTGILMVKYAGAWMRVDLELPQPRVQPLL